MYFFCSIHGRSFSFHSTHRNVIKQYALVGLNLRYEMNICKQNYYYLPLWFRVVKPSSIGKSVNITRRIIWVRPVCIFKRFQSLFDSYHSFCEFQQIENGIFSFLFLSFSDGLNPYLSLFQYASWGGQCRMNILKITLKDHPIPILMKNSILPW